MKYFLVVVLFLVGCASVKPLEGGDKDTTPPQVRLYSPDSASVNFSGNQIQIEFDEYIRGQNLSQNILISPRPETNPSSEIRGKSLFINFQEKLLTNTTYTVMLNEAIVDVNEANILTDFKYLFSTGSSLDSMMATFYIHDYFNNKPCERCLIALYHTADSTVLEQKPSYLNYTSEFGKVSLTNLPDTSFYAIAFKDDNKNLTLDYDELVSDYQMVNYGRIDTLTVNPYTNYTPQKPRLIKPKECDKLQFVFNNPVRSTNVSLLKDSVSLPYTFGLLRDTLFTHYEAEEGEFTYSLIIDTFKFSYETTIKEDCFDYPVTLKANHTNQSITLTTNTFVKSIDSTKLFITMDSIQKTKYSYAIDNQIIEIKFDQNISYPLKIKLQPDAITSIYNSSSTMDSFLFFKPQEGLPNLTLNVSNPDSKPFIINILDKNNKLIRSLNNTKDSTLITPNLQPGIYKVKAILDGNNNSIWDPGNIFDRKPYERLIFSEDFELRPNWDQKLDLLLH